MAGYFWNGRTRRAPFGVAVALCLVASLMVATPSATAHGSHEQTALSGLFVCHDFDPDDYAAQGWDCPDVVDQALSAGFGGSVNYFIVTKVFFAITYLNWTSDGCSIIPEWTVNAAFGNNFACQRHDFNYRNFGSSNDAPQLRPYSYVRAAADDLLGQDLETQCNGRWTGWWGWIGPICRAYGNAIESAVENCGWNAFFSEVTWLTNALICAASYVAGHWL